MLAALIHGNVPSLVRQREDVLTSRVFGLLDPMPAQAGFAPWLGMATRLDRAELSLELETLDRRAVAFWPRPELEGKRALSPPHLRLDDEAGGIMGRRHPSEFAAVDADERSSSSSSRSSPSRTKPAV
jgi:hypothetical protein